MLLVPEFSVFERFSLILVSKFLVRIVRVKQKGGIILKIKREKFLKEQIEISIQKQEKSYSEND